MNDDLTTVLRVKDIQQQQILTNKCLWVFIHDRLGVWGGDDAWWEAFKEQAQN